MACVDPGGAKRAGTRTASAAGVMALSESFSEPHVPGDQKASLASLSPHLHPFGHLEGSLAWGSFSVVQHVRHIEDPLAGVLLCSSVLQMFDGPASLLFSCHAGMWGERG